MTKPHLRELYDEGYYKNYSDQPYERSEIWRNFFGGIARRIAADFQPKTTLDAGCAIGLLVEALRENGVESYGFDVSEWAVKQMPGEYTDFVKRDSVLNPKAFEKKFDLVTCIEVLEHLQPSEADAAVKNLCGWGDIVIFTSTPDDYEEATHFNVQQPGYWAEKFARYGFVRVLSYDAGYIAPWAQVFRRETPVFPSLARQYEDVLWVKTKQIHSQQQSIVAIQQSSEAQTHLIETSQAEIAALAAEVAVKDSRLTQEVAERKRIAEELENFRSLRDSYDKLQKKYANLKNSFADLEDQNAALRENHLNLQNDFSELRELHAALNNARARDVEHLHAATETLDKICRTKSWKAVNFWWKSKQKVVFWVPEKRERFSVLYNTSADIWQNQGSAALANRLFRFLRGERLHANLLPPPNSPETIAESAELLSEETSYQQWIRNNEPDAVALGWQKRREKRFKYRPLISILTPVFNTEKSVFEKMVESVLAQTYSNWELCLVDGNSTDSAVRPLLEKYARLDARIKVKFLNENLGISGNSNEALRTAKGEFVALLDHDDELTKNALYENVVLLNQNPQADMIYSDEDKLDAADRRCSPFFKPDWSPDLLRSIMYTCHLGVYRTELVKQLGGFRSPFDGSQDHDLVLRLIEKTDRIFHIPKILYHWRMTPGSTALDSGAKDYAQTARINAVQEHCGRIGLRGVAEPGLFNGAVRLKYLPEVRPLISIIIPTRDKTEVLKQCVNSIFKLSTYQNYEILIVDNNSREQTTFDYFESLEKQPNVRILDYPSKFNFSAINNFAADEARGEILLFLNNDTEVISAGWLEAMLEHAARKEVGAVGARLIYPDKTVQHAGVIIGMGGIAGHAHLGLFQGDAGYFGRAHLVQNFSAVTGACMMTKAEDFRAVGGFNERDLAVAFNDVDYCLKLREKGLLIVYTPYAELYHYESLSRGSDLTPENIERFQREIKYMEQTWSAAIQNDPYYNPNLSLDLSHSSFTLSHAPRCGDAAEFSREKVAEIVCI